ncbi:AraC-like DNA-binding protein [Panacagrimonas perspica]|uniref:AraC-like DNA-binding protein n=1 Tax=Panacagrimonas perspica TaxID=381431 RepID=A0A4R7PEF1_9GAMM|nr:AraC-like DNA-binding protein [Panacagrimonas perspica]
MRHSTPFADGASSAVVAPVGREAIRRRGVLESGVDWLTAAGCQPPVSPSGLAVPSRSGFVAEERLDGGFPRRGLDFVTGPSQASLAYLGSFEALKRWVKGSLPWLNVSNRHGEAFEARATHYRVGSSLFLTVRADACDATRSPHPADAAHPGCIQVIWPLAGRTEVEQDGRSFGLEDGELAVCDTSRPYRVSLAGRASLAVLLLPHDAFPGWQQLGSCVCGRSIRQSIATRAALAALMSLNSLPADVVAGQGGPVLSAVKWMLGNALLQREAAMGEDEAPCGALIAKARQHIVEHVADPGLSPDDVASALCMSRRSLYLLFKAHRLTPSKMIHDIRLNQVRRALEDPAQAHQKMTHIALDAGFADYATFSRLFKAHFGVTPSDFRSRHRLALCA